MLLNLATLSLVLTVASAPDSIRRAPSGSAPPDSRRIVHRDSTPPLARRTMARVGFGAESEHNVAARESAGPPTDTTQRRHAVEYSDWYYKRLTIHKVASYATIPLFVIEYVLGDKLYDGTASSSTRSAHQAVAAGIGVLFGVNTVTGVWNLWESRHESEGRARRTTHAVLMLVADAGFAAALPFAFVTGVRLPNGADVSFPIPATDGATIDRNNDMILARYQGKVYAFGLACPHQNTALRWLAEEGRFQCPKHKSKYGPDGTFLSGRATRSMDRYAVRKDGSNVVVNLDTMYQEDKQKPEWENAFVPA